jgi:hypothetical protein
MNRNKGSAIEEEILRFAQDCHPERSEGSAQPITRADGTSFVPVHYRGVSAVQRRIMPLSPQLRLREPNRERSDLNEGDKQLLRKHLYVILYLS